MWPLRASLFGLLAAFHGKKQGKRNKQVSYAVGFSKSRSPSHIVEKARVGGASRAFFERPEPFPISFSEITAKLPR
jgi:hypothetical protein